MKERKFQPLKPVKDTRHAVHDIFNVEFGLLRKYMVTYPILTLAIPFLIGLLFGGLLQSDITWYLILCMTGFTLPLPFGLNMGIPSYQFLRIRIRVGQIRNSNRQSIHLLLSPMYQYHRQILFLIKI